LAFSASFAWCSGSPSFTLTDVPPGTARLQFAMTDLNVPSFHHGGGTVAYSGQTAVPCGAFSSGFTGPSPPPGQVHTYQFSIKALGPKAQCSQRPRRGASFRSDNRVGGIERREPSPRRLLIEAVSKSVVIIGRSAHRARPWPASDRAC
jgi:phosphatidylethanolamine-binding protein (PEBP) family uncharacterized protein